MLPSASPPTCASLFITPSEHAPIPAAFAVKVEDGAAKGGWSRCQALVHDARDASVVYAHGPVATRAAGVTIDPTTVSRDDDAETATIGRMTLQPTRVGHVCRLPVGRRLLTYRVVQDGGTLHAVFTTDRPPAQLHNHSDHRVVLRLSKMPPLYKQPHMDVSAFPCPGVVLEPHTSIDFDWQVLPVEQLWTLHRDAASADKRAEVVLPPVLTPTVTRIFAKSPFIIPTAAQLALAGSTYSAPFLLGKASLTHVLLPRAGGSDVTCAVTASSQGGRVNVHFYPGDVTAAAAGAGLRAAQLNCRLYVDCCMVRLFDDAQGTSLAELDADGSPAVDVACSFSSDVAPTGAHVSYCGPCTSIDSLTVAVAPLRLEAFTRDLPGRAGLFATALGEQQRKLVPAVAPAVEQQTVQVAPLPALPPPRLYVRRLLIRPIQATMTAPLLTVPLLLRDLGLKDTRLKLSEVALQDVLCTPDRLVMEMCAAYAADGLLHLPSFVASLRFAW